VNEAILHAIPFAIFQRKADRFIVSIEQVDRFGPLQARNDSKDARTGAEIDRGFASQVRDVE
jgi:hypothetical protein